MVRRVLVSAALATSIAACSGSGSKAQPGGAAEPEKAVRAFADAIGRGDVAAMKRLMVSPERIRKALDCPGGENLVNDVAQAHQALAELEKVKGELGAMGVTLEGMREESNVTIDRGATFHGCTAREKLEARRYKVELSAPAAGSGDEPQEVIKLDGAWFMLPIS
jgi:hypothetical protein